MRKDFSDIKLRQILKKYFSNTQDLIIEKAEEGISTNVFKISTFDRNFYLRISGYEDESFDPEVLAHQKILQKGVTIPKVLYYENFNKVIGHSFMIINEIKGFPASEVKDECVLDKILFAAGMDLARCNSVEVKGFGYIEREGKLHKELGGGFKDYKSYYLWLIDQSLQYLLDTELLDQKLFQELQNIVNSNNSYLKATKSCLMHGDFDLSHIYTDGKDYTGIIDFGDITGANIYTDLAHYAIYSKKGLVNLVEGYSQISKLHFDWMKRVCFAGIPVATYKLSWKVKNTPKNNKGAELDFLRRAVNELK